MSRSLWLVQLIKEAFPNRYLAARLTRAPVPGRMLEYWLLEGDALIYLPAERVTLILQALEQIMQGRTSLVIAHRLRTVLSADQILVIDA